MIVHLIWDADYPWDVRIEKVANSLIRAGHEVHLTCRNTKRSARYEHVDGLHIHRLPKLSLLPHKLSKALSFPLFFNPLWLHSIWKVSKNSKANCILVRDLPLCPAALFLARALRIPCVLDMAECYPEMLRCTWEFGGFKIQNIVLRNPWLADLVERYCIKRLDMILVMIDESRTRLLEMGVNPERLRIVSNTPRLPIPNTRVDSANIPDEPLRLVYIGLLNPSRGLDTVIQGARELLRLGVRFELLIAGSGADSERLREFIVQYDLLENVKLLGWIDHDRMWDLLRNASIGLVPHHICSHWNHTIPNKLFDYMAAGIPVLSTNVVPMTRLLEETQCGITFTDYEPTSFADAVLELQDPSRRHTLGSNGQKAVKDRWNWSEEEHRLLSALNECTSQRMK